jgi:hypothetical protein
MIKWMFILLLFPMKVMAIQSIDISTWGAVTNSSNYIIIDCDCTEVINTDGSKSVTINKVRHIHKVGGQTTCVIASPSDFFINIANKPVSLYTAMIQSGGSSWVTNDNVTWYRLIMSPFRLYAETPDPWCIGK